MNHNIDNDLKDLHDQFKTDHTEECNRLMQAASDQTPQTPTHSQALLFIMKRSHALAVAAAMAIAVWLAFFANGRGNVAWAALLDQLRHVSSISWRQVIVTSTDGYADSNESAQFWNQCYLKEPNLFRSEEWIGSTMPVPGPTPRIRLVQIYRQEPQRLVQIHLRPDQKTATRWFDERLADSDSALSIPNEIWQKLQNLRDKTARELGATKIEEVDAQGFELSYSSVDPLVHDPEGTVRIWVHPDDAIPLRIELRCRIHDTYTTTFLTNIKWNVPIDDDMFTVPDEPDWQIEDHTYPDIPKQLPTFRLRPDVTFSITSQDGHQILTEKHVATAALLATENEAAPSYSLAISVTPEGDEILRSYTKDHIGQTVTIKLNGQVVGQPTIQSQVSEGFRIDLPPDQIDLDNLLEQIPQPDSPPDTE